MVSISYKCTQKLLQNFKCHEFVPRTAFHFCSKLTNHRYTTEELYKGTGNTVFEPYEPGRGNPEDYSKVPSKKEIKKGLKTIGEEFDKWIDEKKESLKFDPEIDLCPGN